MAYGSVKIDSIVTSTKTVTVDNLATTSDLGAYVPSSAIGTTVQPYDAQLADVAGLTPGNGNIIIGNGTNFVVQNGATARASLGLAIGTDIQAYNADLNAVAALSSTGLINRTGAGTAVTVSPPSGDLVGTSATQTLTAKTLTSPVLTGVTYANGSYQGNVTAVAALDIDCSAGNYFTKTINANSTFTVSNVPADRAYSFTLELTHTSGTVTWFSGVQWPGGTAPTLTAGKTHLFAFVTDDGGSRWRGASLVDYTN